VRVWFSDCESFKYDWLFIFKERDSGETKVFWNDYDGVKDFLNTEIPIICGYNYTGYDQFILKAVMLEWSPEQINELSHLIISTDDRSEIYNLFREEAYVVLPHIIELFHDIVPRKSLKEIEGNIGMSIEESDISFDVDHALSPQERDTVTFYCLHDVEATEKLYGLRIDYLQAKVTLCQLCGIDPLPMMKYTNANLISKVLGAQRKEYPNEIYECPSYINQVGIPDAVYWYIHQLDTETTKEKGLIGNVEFTFHGCPTTFGLGGLHAATEGTYIFRKTEGRSLLIQDVDSYYPANIINNDYMSRSIPDMKKKKYTAWRDDRIVAKKEGNKQVADALKLPLNTTFGAMKSFYNDLYDPMQATRICITGQLVIMDVINRIFEVTKHTKLVQINTDGWVIEISDEELPVIQTVIEEWKARTKFSIGTDNIEALIQRDVNNYIMRFDTGKIKTKGGTVGHYNGGDFTSNSATIIDTAITNYFLNGKSIESTINECDDMMMFQIIAKAGGGYNKVHENGIRIVEQRINPASGRLKRFEDWTWGKEVQKCNRVFATTDISKGTLLKFKKDKPARIPDVPEHCVVRNDGDFANVVSELDKQWYVDLANKKASDFIGKGVIMDEDKVEVEVPKKTVRKKKEEKVETLVEETVEQEVVEPVMTFGEKLLALQKALSDASDLVSFDKSVGTKFDYADTQQYKHALALYCNQIGLVFGVEFDRTDYLGVINQIDGKLEGTSLMYGAMVFGKVTLLDSDAKDTTGISYDIVGMGTNTTPGYIVGAAQTNALRSFILNNFLMDNTGRDGDDQKFMETDYTKPQKKEGGYVTPEQKAEIKKAITSKETMATVMYADELYGVIQKALELDPNFESKVTLLIEEGYADGKALVGEDGNSLLTLKRVNKVYEAAEKIIAKAGN
jgi:hypothetical protein